MTSSMQKHPSILDIITTFYIFILITRSFLL